MTGYVDNRNGSAVSFFNLLPPELKVYIFEQLDIKTLLKPCCSVSREWCDLIIEEIAVRRAVKIANELELPKDAPLWQTCKRVTQLALGWLSFEVMRKTSVNDPYLIIFLKSMIKSGSLEGFDYLCYWNSLRALFSLRSRDNKQQKDRLDDVIVSLVKKAGISNIKLSEENFSELKEDFELSDKVLYELFQTGVDIDEDEVIKLSRKYPECSQIIKKAEEIENERFNKNVKAVTVLAVNAFAAIGLITFIMARPLEDAIYAPICAPLAFESINWLLMHILNID